jgi:hypothetical protein
LSSANGSLLDFEVIQSYPLTVTVTDSGSPPRQSQATFLVELADSNEAAPKVDDQSFEVFENTQTATPIGHVVATDEDFFQNLRFAIVSGNVGGAFGIHSSTGELFVVNEVLDFESRPRYTLTVEVTDDGEPARSDTATVTINVLNANDPMMDITLDNNTVRERVPGAYVGRVRVIDQDNSEQHTLAVDDGRFEINSRRELKLKNSMSLEVDDETQILIHITASGEGGEQRTKPFVILVTAASSTTTPWQNPREPRDVNDDGAVTPQDVLVIINEINNPQHSDPSGRLFVPRPDIPGLPLYDVNGDGFVTAIDVLIIINHLNQSSAEPEGDGESAGERVAGNGKLADHLSDGKGVPPQLPLSPPGSFAVDRPQSLFSPSAALADATGLLDFNSNRDNLAFVEFGPISSVRLLTNFESESPRPPRTTYGTDYLDDAELFTSEKDATRWGDLESALIDIAEDLARLRPPYVP